MKKILVLLIGSTLAFASQANSNQQNSGGFVAPKSAITTTESKVDLKVLQLAKPPLLKQKHFQMILGLS